MLLKDTRHTTHANAAVGGNDQQAGMAVAVGGEAHDSRGGRAPGQREAAGARSLILGRYLLAARLAQQHGAFKAKLRQRRGAGVAAGLAHGVATPPAVVL